MKIALYILAGLGLAGVAWYFMRPKPAQTMLTQEQKNAGNDAVLSAYSDIMPPIAQLARVPWTNNNFRMVDPYVQAPVGPTVIAQNGNN